MVISKLLLDWYYIHKRDLPWRGTNNSYLIWVSEIILQQTRINQGMGYYQRFIDKFPTVQALASAQIEEVLKIWQGLGYYSRARNMHSTARWLVENTEGIFPEKYTDLLKLKGIGEYTAAAIASIVSNEVVPAIDGNVKRVIARLFSIQEDLSKASGKKILLRVLKENIDSDHPGDFNQALMDLGALICKPANPECSLCPLAHICLGNQYQTVNELPVKYQRKVVKERYLNYFVLESEDKIIIKQRKDNDIWALLYDFPLAETPKRQDDSSLKELFHKNFIHYINKPVITDISSEITHILSHQKLFCRFISVRAGSISDKIPKEYRIISKTDLDHYAFPRLIEKFLNDES